MNFLPIPVLGIVTAKMFSESKNESLKLGDVLYEALK